MNTRRLIDLAQQLRVDSVRAADAAGSGHPTSSMSAADLMAVMLANHTRYDFERPQHPGNDRFVLSKGHASPLLYAAFRAIGIRPGRTHAIRVADAPPVQAKATRPRTGSASARLRCLGDAPPSWGGRRNYAHPQIAHDPANL